MLAPALVVLFAAALLAGPLASVASGDGGCGGIGRPPCTILRPVPAPAHRWVDAGAPACVVVVGGLGSPPSDGFFDPILDRLTVTDAGRPLVHLRFGYDRGDRYRYDTTGAIDRNAAQLRALVRDLSDECYTIDVLAHSMGGVVADRAFSMGMSSNDGVTTYLPLASPHNGSFAARAARLGVELDDTFADAVHTIAQRTGMSDPTSDAVRDLARPKTPRPPRGVETVRPHLATDLTVLRGDSVDRRYDVREYRPGSLAEVEGHGGIVKNESVQEVVTRTIRTHVVPPDDRSAAEKGMAEYASRFVQRYWGGLVALGGLALADVAIGSAVGSAIRDAAEDVAAGDVVGAATDLAGGVAGLAGRAIEHRRDEAELIHAALELRQPIQIGLLKTLLETAFQ